MDKSAHPHPDLEGEPAPKRPKLSAESDMDTRLYDPPQPSHALPGGMEEYRTLHEESVSSETSDAFWANQASSLSWFEPYTQVTSGGFELGDIKWFLNGKLNVSFNCLDRHLAERSDQVAIIWEGDEPGDVRRFTYAQVHAEVCKFANVLKTLGVQKGECVTVYMPMVPETAFVMLACARIGAPHSVVFAGFSAESLRDRILDCSSKVVITADQGVRGGKTIPLKKTVDEALAGTPSVGVVVVLRRTGTAEAPTAPMTAGRDVYYEDVMASASSECVPEAMDSEDPLFMLYTSGSTGKPKGIMHTQAGYLVFTSFTHRTVFDVRPGDVYACVADVGWITGHSYIVYGPLCNGATTFMFESTPLYPDFGRYWDVVERHSINVFYTAPTALRSLMKAGDEIVRKYNRSSLRVLGTVGEPINPEAWRWYYNVVGEGRCSIVDTFWQTETGGHMITPIAGVTPQKPGAATLPFFGVQPVLVDAQSGAVIEGNDVSGVLCIGKPWPGIARTVFGDHDRYLNTYMRPYPGLYFTGDGCYRDSHGYYQITGRVDDVINTSGHRIGSAEVESSIVQHGACAEAAVVGYPHEIKGQGIFCYVTLKDGVTESHALSEAIMMEVRKHLGAFAKPDVIVFAPGLPKTRSGKIMRRILRKIACGELDGLGDVSTLADPSVVDTLIQKVAEALGRSS